MRCSAATGIAAASCRRARPLSARILSRVSRPPPLPRCPPRKAGDRGDRTAVFHQFTEAGAKQDQQKIARRAVHKSASSRRAAAPQANAPAGICQPTSGARRSRIPARSHRSKNNSSRKQTDPTTLSPPLRRESPPRRGLRLPVAPMIPRGEWGVCEPAPGTQPKPILMPTRPNRILSTHHLHQEKSICLERLDLRLNRRELLRILGGFRLEPRDCLATPSRGRRC
jgi:hypothetical protein